MHPAQVHAILAMVDSVETMCRNIKQQLVMAQTMMENGAWTPAAAAPPAKTSKDPTHPEYLSDKEEELIEMQLEMQRKTLTEQEQKVQAEWARQREVIKDEVSF